MEGVGMSGIGTLFWKDYRQNRRLLVACGLFLLFPYVLMLAFGVAELVGLVDIGVRHGQGWIGLVHAAGFVSVAFSVLAAAFIGGNAVAAERADRSAEFAAYVPIPRRSAMTSKAILAFCACLLVWAINTLIHCRTAAMLNHAYGHNVHFVYETVPFTAATTLLLFCVSWMFSSFLKSPAIAAASGLAVAVAFAGTLAVIADARNIDKEVIRHAYLASCLFLGVLSFLAGALYSLRRVEP
jgi:ABC-type transport system involved in multi-copper enzyme maturation permease subunit